MGSPSCPGCGAPQGMGMGGGLMPPPPAAMAGQAAMSLVPGQMQQQAQLTQGQQQQTIAALMSVFQSAPNPAAEAAQSEPSPMVAGGPPSAPNDPNGGY